MRIDIQQGGKFIGGGNPGLLRKYACENGILQLLCNLDENRLFCICMNLQGHHSFV